MIFLKNETYFLIPDFYQFLFLRLFDCHAIQQIVSAVHHIHAPDDIHERTFSGTGRTQNGKIFSLLYGQRHIFEHMEGLRSHAVGFVDISHCDYVCIFYTFCFCGRADRRLHIHHCIHISTITSSPSSLVTIRSFSRSPAASR